MDIKYQEGVIPYERKRVIVAFGDIHGYGQWIKRAATSIEKHSELVEHIYHLAKDLCTTNKYHLKLVGDGFIIIKEIGKENGKDIVVKFMRELHEITHNIIDTIKALPFPRPAGFRVRLVSGYVSKFSLQYCSLNEDEFCGIKDEYAGYIMVMANRLLYFMEDNPCICHESVKELTGETAKGNGFIVEMYKLPEMKSTITEIDQEDLNALYSYTVRTDERN